MIQSKPTFTMSLTEEELQEAVEYYIANVYEQTVKIKRIEHKECTWTEGGGGMPEMDYSTPDGIEFTCEVV